MSPTLISHSRRDGDLYIHCNATDTTVTVGEHTDNPHDRNHATSCTRDEFLAGSENGKRCRSIILSNFPKNGPAIIAEIEAAYATQR